MKNFYSFGDDIKIYSNKCNFYLTVLKLGVIAEPLCSKKCNEEEVKQMVYEFLINKSQVVANLLKHVQ